MERSVFSSFEPDMGNLEEVASIIISCKQAGESADWEIADVALRAEEEAAKVAQRQHRLAGRKLASALKETRCALASMCHCSEAYLRQHILVARAFPEDSGTRVHGYDGLLEFSFYRMAAMYCPTPEAAQEEIVVAAEQSLSVREFQKYLIAHYRVSLVGIPVSDGNGHHLIDNVDVTALLTAYEEAGRCIQLQAKMMVGEDE